MVRRDPHLFNLKPMVLPHIQKNLFYLRSNIFLLYPFPIFRCPYQMIFGVVNRMRCPPDCHETSYITFFLPSADAPFIPVHRTEFSGANLNKGIGAFQGGRTATAPSPGITNSIRYAGRAFWHPFEAQTGFFYAGTILGSKKILALGATFNLQVRYNLFSLDLFYEQPG